MKLTQRKKNIKKIAYDTSVPMKKWAIIFFVSLVTLYFCNIQFLGNIVALAGFIYICYTLRDTKTFIQECLRLNNAE